MTKEILIFILVLITYTKCFSQNEAKIEYRYINFIEKYSSKSTDANKKLTPGYNISKMIEEIPFILTFDGSKSEFRIKKRMGVGDKSSTYNQLITMLPKTYIDIEDKIKYDYTEISGQPFLVKEKLNPNWKIVDEKKIIKGYKCIKAVQFDDDGKIKTEAWFAPELPLSTGPSSQVGLPGLVISTKQFNKNGEAYAGYELVDVDVSKQKKVIIPDHETMTLKEFTKFMEGSKNKFN